jgi:hypothetical protein
MLKYLLYSPSPDENGLELDMYIEYHSDIFKNRWQQINSISRNLPCINNEGAYIWLHNDLTQRNELALFDMMFNNSEVESNLATKFQKNYSIIIDSGTSFGVNEKYARCSLLCSTIDFITLIERVSYS